MNVVSLKLSKELYELSRWHKPEYFYATNDLEFRSENYEVVSKHHPHFPHGFILQDFTPAYDLGYLLRKLPRALTVNNSTDTKHRPFASDLYWKNLGQDDLGIWTSWYRQDHEQTGKFMVGGSTPEDAAAKLAIELFKQGILTRTGDE